MSSTTTVKPAHSDCARTGVELGPLADWLADNATAPPVSRPQHLKIETTTTCNARCAFCAYDSMNRPKGTMPMARFEQTVTQFVEAGGRAITLCPNMGEVLCDPHFLDRLRTCRSHGETRWVAIVTNLIGLNRLDDGQLAEALELTDLWSCSIGPNRAVYRTMFGVDRFERVLEGLERIRRLIGSTTRRPEIQLHGRGHAGEFEIDPRIPGLAEAFGQPRLNWTVAYSDWGGKTPGLPNGTPVKRTDDTASARPPCNKPLEAAVALWDGRVGFCACGDYDAKLVIGHLDEERLGPILAGRGRRGLLASFLEGTLNAYCRKCTFYAPLTARAISDWEDWRWQEELLERRDEVRRLLVVRSSSMPVFTRQIDRIRAALPGAVLDCVTNSETTTALRSVFQQIHPYDRKRFAVEPADTPLFDRLRRTGYDLGVATYQRDDARDGYANVHEFLEAARPATLAGLTPSGRWIPTGRRAPAAP